MEGARVVLGWRRLSKPMNDLQTMQFTVVTSFVSICIILGLIITELWRKLSAMRDEVERLRRMASKNYSHRKCLEDAAFAYMEANGIDQAAKKLTLLRETANWSKDDHD